jgi:hypothetical protein
MGKNDVSNTDSVLPSTSKQEIRQRGLFIPRRH